MDSCLLTLRRPFVADHFHDLPGFVEARHGHNWEIAATVRLSGADHHQAEAAFAASLEAWVAEVDYTLLNEQPPLEGRNPTAEALASWGFHFLQTEGMNPECVRIREKTNYWARCRSAA
ncbi:MAG: 6-carboxytetrahydropterin synthase [Acidobacteriota bacterium]|nr:6-carboxytetrahydropterin synthase [Acidobacteriota bacterium]